MLPHEYYMQEALKQAQLAYEADEVPVGVVIVHQGTIIARAHNQVEMLKDPTAHAEMIAITQATHALSSKWLHDCQVYVTLEPCPMCAGALVLARIKQLIFGAYDTKTGSCGTVLNLSQHKDLNHKFSVIPGIMEDVCSSHLSRFFQEKRREP